MAETAVNVDFANDANTIGYTSSDLEGEIGSDNERQKYPTSTDVGDTDTSGNLPDFNTLDEPIKETILRDLKAVAVKFYHVFIPRKSQVLLKEWDLWGPLILCIFFAMFLQDSTADDAGEGGPQFAQVFVITFLGSFVVTLNSKLLGGTLSFFQSVCVLGYCLVPLCLSLIVSKLILLSTDIHNILPFIIRSIVVLLSCAWAIFASFVFLSNTQPANRKSLAMYPIFLYYFIISWLVLSHNT